MFIGSVRNASAFLKEILDCMKLLLPLNSRGLKSYDMRTIYAILGANFPVVMMARCSHFSC
jgi:uncharacterized protein YjfI (DUF2170 family)